MDGSGSMCQFRKLLNVIFNCATPPQRAHRQIYQAPQRGCPRERSIAPAFRQLT
jgi:hypothetical protein